MTLPETIQTRLLNYQSAASREQDSYFSAARSLAEAHFRLADEQLCDRLWQDVADRHLDLDRVMNLMYGCWFHDDRTEMREADVRYLVELRRGRHRAIPEAISRQERMPRRME